MRKGRMIIPLALASKENGYDFLMCSHYQTVKSMECHRRHYGVQPHVTLGKHNLWPGCVTIILIANNIGNSDFFDRSLGISVVRRITGHVNIHECPIREAVGVGRFQLITIETLKS